MKLAGYVRVSTKEQDYNKQIEEIKNFCKYKGHEVEFFKEKASAVKERPEFDRMINTVFANQYEGIIAVALDRIGRSVSQLSRVGDSLRERNKVLIITSMNLDTSTKEGKLLFNLLASIAEYERIIIRERVMAGKRYSGNYGGRKTKQLPREAIIEHFEKGASYEWLANTYGVSTTTIYRRLKEWELL